MTREDKKDAGVGLLVLTKKIQVNGVPAVQGSDGNVYDYNADGEIENLPKAATIVGIGLGCTPNSWKRGPNRCDDRRDSVAWHRVGARPRVE